MDGATCLFRPMTEADIPQVYAIDHEAFPAESLFRPYSSYAREMHNPMAHYVVSCIPSEHRLRQRRASLLRRLAVRRWAATEDVCYDELVVGFAGFWTMLDEAHIIAIAVGQRYRRQGIGEGLLLSAIDSAAKLQSNLVTLEVRLGNLGAQAMYSKYGFAVVGRRPRYYSDNQEDAILMTLDHLQTPEVRHRLADMKSRLLVKECLAHTVELPDVSAGLES